MRQPRGVSILEVLVVVAVLAVVLGIGFVNLPRDTLAVNQVAQRITQDIQRAKFEAINRNVGVTLTFSASGYEAVITNSGARVFAESFAGTDFAAVNLELVGNAIEFDTRGVGRSAGTRLIRVFHLQSGYEVVLEVNQQGRTQRQ